MLHQAELNRERPEILRSSPKDLNRRIRGQNILGALWHEFQDLIAEAQKDGINRIGKKEYWSMDVIGEIVRKVYLLLLPLMFRQRYYEARYLIIFDVLPTFFVFYCSIRLRPR